MLPGRPQEMPGIVVDHGDARIGVRVIRMMRSAEADDGRVDLDSIHMAHAVAQRRGDVSA